MKLTRRATLSLSAAITGLLAGCSEPQRQLNTMTQDTRPDFIIKTDSNEPVYTVQLRVRDSQNKPGSEPVDLTNATNVQFLMPISDSGMVNESATIVDAPNGEVSVSLPNGIPDGDYDAEFRVDFDDGSELFWPQNRNLLVAVRAGTDRELADSDLSDPDASVTTLFTDNLAANSGTEIALQDRLNAGGTEDIVGLSRIETVEAQIDALTSHLDAGTNDITNIGTLESQSHSTDDAQITGTDPITINVPSDETTVDDAITEAATIVQNRDRDVELNIETGHEIQSRIWINNLDLRGVTITSEDATVPLDTFSVDSRVLLLRSCVGLTWDIYLDGNGHTEWLLDVAENSSLVVTANSGATNGDRGIEISRNSIVFAEDSNFSANEDRNVSITRNSIGFFDGADLSTTNTGHGVRIADSSVKLDDTVITNCGSAGIHGWGAVSARRTDVSGCSIGIDAYGGWWRLGSATISTSANPVSGVGIDARGSSVNADSVTVESPGSHGIVCRNDAAKVTATGITVADSGSNGVTARDGSVLSVVNGTITGSSFFDVETQTGSIASTNKCVTTSSTGDDPHVNDVSHTGLDEAAGLIFGTFEQ